MEISARALNRATLARQLLLRRHRLDPVEALRRIVAVQAQEPASPYIALFNRVSKFDPSALDAAFAEHAVVKATLMRMTLHAVTAEDYPAFHGAFSGALRAGRLGDPRFAQTGLGQREVDDLIEHLVKFARSPRSNADFAAEIEWRIGAVPEPGAWWAIRFFAPFTHAPTGGPWMFGPRPAYHAAPHPPNGHDSAVNLQIVVRRYLEGFGPATLLDIAQFVKLRRSDVRTALNAISDQLVTYDGTNGVLWDVPGAELPAENVAAPPRLMAMWDSVLLAYADRARVIPEPYRKAVIRANGDTLPTLLVDGYVAGVWRPTPEGIEAAAFQPLPPAAWKGLHAEAKKLIDFLHARDTTVYRRYARWWQRLPAEDVRLLS